MHRLLEKPEISCAPRVLRAAHTPDPDDAYAWSGIARGGVEIAGYTIAVEAHPIQHINQACQHEQYDLAAISSAAYPWIADRYAILDAGASVGRGYGPALVAREALDEHTMRQAPVAIPGDLTTAAMLLRIFYPGIQTVAVPCEEIPRALLRGDFQAGVLIHEQLMIWESQGLRRIGCLGALWGERTGLPIPVGLVVARRALGLDCLHALDRALRLSLIDAQSRPQDAMQWALGYTHQQSVEVGTRYVEMFANEDTLHLADDCVEALQLFYKRALQTGLIEQIPEIQPVGGERVDR